MELLGMAALHLSRESPMVHMHLRANPQVAFSSGRGIQARIVPTASRALDPADYPRPPLFT